MIRKSLFVLLSLLMLAAGSVGGDWFRQRDQTPATEALVDQPVSHATPAAVGAAASPSGDAAHKGKALSSFRFPQQFFVPLVRNGNVEGVMVLSLSLEMPRAAEEAVYRQENQLRDALLRQLLIHANSGGFDGNFTAEAHLELLRQTLLQSAQRVAGRAIAGVLIGDISRQPP